MIWVCDRMAPNYAHRIATWQGDLHRTSQYASDMSSLADRLKLARERAGYDNATAAAEAMGVRPPTYLGHENGSRGFTPETAKRYARFFRVKPEWLILGDGDPAPDRGNVTALPDLRAVARRIPVL